MDATEAKPKRNRTLAKASYKLMSLINDAGLLPDLDLKATTEAFPSEYLGDVLVHTEALRETDLQALLMTSLRIPRIQAARIEVPDELAALLPEDLCREHGLAPVSRARDFLTVAMVNPLLDESVEKVEKITGLNVRRVLCSANDLARLIQRAYNEDGDEGMADLYEQDAQEDISAALTGAAEVLAGGHGAQKPKTSAPQEEPADPDE